MKTILAFIVAVSAFRFSASQNYTGVKITFYGFVCQQQTADDILDMDGAGDEIFLTFYIKSALSNEMKLSSIYGDIRKSSIRFQAGTASTFGGIKTGNMIPSQKEYNSGNPQHIVVMNSNIGPDDYAVVVPVIWESDDGTYTQPFRDWQKATSDRLKNPDFHSSINTARSTLNLSDAPGFSYLLPGRYYGFNEAYKNIFTPLAGNKPGTRPIGLMQDMTFSSQLLLVTRASAKAMAQHDYGYGKGIVPVLYNEVSLGNTAYHGVYSILLKVEATDYGTSAPTNPPPPPAPKPAPVPAPTPTPAPPGTTPITYKKDVIKSVNNKIVMQDPGLSNELLAGVWNGTKGTSNSAGDEPFHFKFSNNVFWLLKNDGSGVAIASGGYSISNGNFKTIFKDADNREYVVSSTGYNASTKEMSGGWTCTGANYYKTGLWVVKKISN